MQPRRWQNGNRPASSRFQLHRACQARAASCVTSQGTITTLSTYDEIPSILAAMAKNIANVSPHDYYCRSTTLQRGSRHRLGRMRSLGNHLAPIYTELPQPNISVDAESSAWDQLHHPSRVGTPWGPTHSVSSMQVHKIREMLQTWNRRRRNCQSLAILLD